MTNVLKRINLLGITHRKDLKEGMNSKWVLQVGKKDKWNTSNKTRYWRGYIGSEGKNFYYLKRTECPKRRTNLFL